MRSQDKMNLVKIDQVNIDYQDNKQIIANYVPELYENSACYYELLGIYETKERALEVLDKISDLLQNAYVGNANRIFYQMPKE